MNWRAEYAQRHLTLGIEFYGLVFDNYQVYSVSCQT